MSSGEVLTKLLTKGWIRSAERTLPSKNIPIGIGRLIGDFMGNYYENHGEHCWQITDQKTLHRMHLSTVFQSFESAPFEMAKMQWKLRLYPNGDRSINRGLFKVMLKPLSFDPEWSRISFLRTIEIDECDHRCSAISSAEKGDIIETTPIRITRFDELQSLTVRVRVQILKICTKHCVSTMAISSPQSVYPKHSSFTYLVTETAMKAMAKERNRRIRRSLVASREAVQFRRSSVLHDGMWILNMYHFPRWSPQITFYLKLTRFIPGVEALKIHFSIQCVETGEVINKNGVIESPEKDVQEQFSVDWMGMNDETLSKGATFRVNIEVVEEHKMIGVSSGHNVIDDVSICRLLSEQCSSQIVK